MANPNFSIQAFVENRWADAKTVLEELDPAFVQAIEAEEALGGILELSSRPKPGTPFTDKWQKFIGATADVSMAIKDLDRCVELTGSVATPVTVHWFTQTFVEKAYNLLDRTKTLVADVCSAYGLGGLKDRYIERLGSTEVQGKIGDRRQPMVHGRGGEGTLVERTIADEPDIDWETAVVVGPMYISQMLADSDGSALLPFSKLSPPEWEGVLSGHAQTLMGNVAQVLSDLELDIERYVKGDKNWPAMVSLC